MLLAVCKENTLANPVEIGSYRGFRMEVYYDTLNTHYCLNLCGKAKHKVELGSDALGNLTRIENELAKIPVKLDYRAATNCKSRGWKAFCLWRWAAGKDGTAERSQYRAKSERERPFRYGYRARPERGATRKKMCKSREIMLFVYL